MPAPQRLQKRASSSFWAEHAAHSRSIFGGELPAIGGKSWSLVA